MAQGVTGWRGVTIFHRLSPRRVGWLPIGFYQLKFLGRNTKLFCIPFCRKNSLTTCLSLHNDPTMPLLEELRH